MHLVDTDVCVDALRGDQAAIDELTALERENPLCIAAVTVHELWQGAYHPSRPEKTVEGLGRFLAAFEALPYDEKTARVGGELAASLRSKGKSIGDLDTMIAATALSHGAILVTRNVRHFRRVPGLAVHGI